MAKTELTVPTFLWFMLGAAFGIVCIELRSVGALVRRLAGRPK